MITSCRPTRCSAGLLARPRSAEGLLTDQMDHEVAGLIRRNLFGIDVDALTMTQAISRCTDAIEHGSYLSVGMVNAAKVVAMHRSERLRDAVGGCGMVLADGQSVVWASRLLGSPLPERVAGIDLFLQLLERAARHAYRVYFLGAQPDVLGRMLTEVGRRYPGLTVAGARHGYFPAEDEPAVAAEVRRSDPDLLFVAMSPPRKELFVSKWGEGTRSNVVHGVGGSFDVLAGLTRRAPAWYQAHGLEWLYRAWQEPARLGRRYATTNMSFMALVARELLRRGVRPGAALPGEALPGGARPGNGAAGADDLQRAAAAAGGEHA
jgi:N-acetylglucosaminyldiphosphoundecaprenol N-acetyl-beta-D-mannosaminyltransferase